MRTSCLLLALLIPSALPAQYLGPGATVPVVANLPGEGGTFWRSDVVVTNLAAQDTSVVLRLVPEILGGDAAFAGTTTDPIELPAGQQLTVSNVVQTRFGLIDAKGALEVYSTTGVPIAVASRTYTYRSGGSYGQDVSGLPVARRAYVVGLQHDSLYRSNLGVYWLWDDPAQFTVTLHRADGTVAGSGTLSFDEAGLQQRALSSFGVESLGDGYAVITCSDPDAWWYAYGSRVDQTSGDAVYRPARGFTADLP